MLEAAIVDLVFTISLKRSTLNRQLSTSCKAEYPIFWRKADIGSQAQSGPLPFAKMGTWF